MDQLLQTNEFLRISPYVSDGEATYMLENLESNTDLKIKDENIVVILNELSEPVKIPEATERVATILDIDSEAAEGIVTALREKEILLRSDELERERDAKTEWSDRGWADAFTYYLCMRDYPFVEWEKTGEWQEEVDFDAVSNVYKTYDDCEKIALKEVEGSDVLPRLGDVLSQPPSPESGTRLSFDVVSSLLSYAFGEREKIEDDPIGRIRKTSPSGGAWHPTEAYVVAFDVQGVDPGLYHYSVRDHALETIATGDEVVDRFDDHANVDTGGPFAIVLTSVVSRDMIKYTDPLAFRVVQQDVGHVVETSRLLGNAFGLHTQLVTDLDRDELAGLLEVNTYHEPVFGCLVFDEDPYDSLPTATK